MCGPLSVASANTPLTTLLALMISRQAQMPAVESTASVLAPLRLFRRHYTFVLDECEFTLAGRTPRAAVAAPKSPWRNLPYACSRTMCLSLKLRSPVLDIRQNRTGAIDVYAKDESALSTSGQSTPPGRPTRLADGLGLESALVRVSRRTCARKPACPLSQLFRLVSFGSPAATSGDAALGYTVCKYTTPHEGAYHPNADNRAS